MKLRLLVYLLIAVTGTIPATAQRYEAQVLDQDDSQPVAYANIGIPGTDAGTNSDSLGRFALDLPEGSKDKVLSVSLIGYEEYKARVADVSGQKTIRLKKSPKALNEVVVKPAKLTAAMLGNNIACHVVSGEKGALPFPFVYTAQKKKKGKEARVDTLTEIGTLMKVKKRKTFIDSVQINVGSCTHANILYRLNLYEELDGEFRNILREPIYIRRSRAEVGDKIVVDLTGKNLVVNHNFVVSIEKVKDLGEGDFSICGKMFGSAMYMRIASLQDKFFKIPVLGMGISAYVTFSEEEK